MITMLSICLLVSIFGMIGCGNTEGKTSTVLNQEDQDAAYFADFHPVLRFTVASDVHIADSDTETQEQRLQKKFTDSYAFSATSETGYYVLDAALIAGDFTYAGTISSMHKVKTILGESVKTETEVILELGKHDFFTEDENTITEFASVFSCEADRHTVINGFHLISIAPPEGGNWFSEKQKQWLREQLEDAAADSTDKPIFVMQHQPVKGTVYGSSGRWGVEGLYDILKAYPQVIDFSGHSYFPINDSRSIWQGDFTAIGTGTLSYLETGLLNVGTEMIFPDDKMGGYTRNYSTPYCSNAQYCIIEADSQRSVRMIAFDLDSNTEIIRFTIRHSADKTTFTYTNNRKQLSDASVYVLTAQLTVSEITSDGFQLALPQAQCTDTMDSYRVQILKDGDLIETKYLLADNFFVPLPQTIQIILSNLEATIYTVNVYAVNCFGVKSAVPLTAEVQLADE